MNIKENFEFAFKNHQKSNFDIAEKYYNKILKIDSGHFESTFLLGTLLAQKKNLDKAKKLLEKAIQIKPNFAEAQNNLGNVLVELKQFEKAKTHYEKAIQIKPNHVDAYYNYGNLLKSLKEYERAINYYKKVVQINPNYLDVCNNLGVVLREIGEYQEAINYYKSAIKVQPNHVFAHYNLALVLEKLSDFTNAKIFFEKAIQIKPDFADAYRALANLFGNLGNFEKAIDCLEKTIKYNPDNLYNYFLLSFYKKKILNSNLKNKIEKNIENNNTSKNIIYGNYLLAMYERDKKNYKKELDFLIKGHKYYYDFKKNNFSRKLKFWFDILPNINKSINLDKCILKSDEKIKPILLVGVPRSGSTLVEKIIASGYKNIPMGEETSVIDNFMKNKIKENEISNYKKEDIRKSILDIYQRKGLINEKNNYTFTDKSLENFFYIGFIKEIFPNIKVINCKRNYVSSIMSIFQNNIVSLSWAHNLENIFKYYDIYLKIVNHYKKKFPNFIYDLEYEKLVKNPEIESKKIFEFCNLPWDKKCLEFYKRKDLISKTASHIQIREAIYIRSLDKYSNYKKLLQKYGKKYPWFN